MNKEIFTSRNIRIKNIPEPQIGETLFEVLMEGFVYGKTLVWATNYDDAIRRINLGNDFGFIRSDDEPYEWEPVENESESLLLFPDNEYIEYDPKDQVIYIPQHVDGDIKDPDCEFGFVVKDLGEDCFVRYWNMTQYRKGVFDLRTKANSERTPKACLYPYKSVYTEIVEANWKKFVEPEGGQNDTITN